MALYVKFQKNLKDEISVENAYCYFEDLSKDRQQELIEKHRYWNVDGIDWWDFTYDDVKRIHCKITSFDLGRCSIDLYFEASVSTIVDAIIEQHGETTESRKLAEAAKLEIVKNERIVENAEKFREKCDQYGDGLMGRNAYSRAGVLLGNAQWELDEGIDERFNKALSKFYLDWLRKEYEYLISDEAIRESLISHGDEYSPFNHF